MTRRFLLIALVVCPVLPAWGADASDWPTFRGPERTAVSPDTGLLKEWPEGGPKMAWETAGAGGGYSSLAIADGRIYTYGDAPSTAADAEAYLSCFSVEDGKQLWLSKIGPAWTRNYNGGRSTPTVDGERVYIVTPHGELVCCETIAGKEIWRKDFKKDFGGTKADGWGYSESVLIDGEKVVCTPGGAKATMVALNKTTGEKLWQADRDGNRGAGHASIVIATVGGTRVYVQTTGSGPMGVRAEDGKILWKYDFPRITAVIPTPIVRGDLVFATAGYGNGGGALLKQVPAGDGEVKVEEVYAPKGELKNKHGGVVLVGEHLYGDNDDRGSPFCAELMTGKVVWTRERRQGPGGGSAAIIAADGCLYIRYADGTMVLAEASPEEYRVLGSFKIPGKGKESSWAHPVIVDGKLFLREWDRIMCYELRG